MPYPESLDNASAVPARGVGEIFASWRLFALESARSKWRRLAAALQYEGRRQEDREGALRLRLEEARQKQRRLDKRASEMPSHF